MKSTKWRRIILESDSDDDDVPVDDAEEMIGTNSRHVDEDSTRDQQGNTDKFGLTQSSQMQHPVRRDRKNGEDNSVDVAEDPINIDRVVGPADAVAGWMITTDTEEFNQDRARHQQQLNCKGWSTQSSRMVRQISDGIDVAVDRAEEMISEGTENVNQGRTRNERREGLINNEVSQTERESSIQMNSHDDDPVDEVELINSEVTENCDQECGMDNNRSGMFDDGVQQATPGQMEQFRGEHDANVDEDCAVHENRRLRFSGDGMLGAARDQMRKVASNDEMSDISVGMEFNERSDVFSLNELPDDANSHMSSEIMITEIISDSEQEDDHSLPNYLDMKRWMKRERISFQDIDVESVAKQTINKKLMSSSIGEPTSNEFRRKSDSVESQTSGCELNMKHGGATGRKPPFSTQNIADGSTSQVNDSPAGGCGRNLGEVYSRSDENAQRCCNIVDDLASKCNKYSDVRNRADDNMANRIYNSDDERHNDSERQGSNVCRSADHHLPEGTSSSDAAVDGTSVRASKGIRVTTIQKITKLSQNDNVPAEAVLMKFGDDCLKSHNEAKRWSFTDDDPTDGNGRIFGNVHIRVRDKTCMKVPTNRAAGEYQFEYLNRQQQLCRQFYLHYDAEVANLKLLNVTDTEQLIVWEYDEEAKTTSDRNRRSSADSYEESTDKYSDCGHETDNDKDRIVSSKRVEKSPIADIRDELETYNARRGPEKRSSKIQYRAPAYSESGKERRQSREHKFDVVPVHHPRSRNRSPLVYSESETRPQDQSREMPSYTIIKRISRTNARRDARGKAVRGTTKELSLHRNSSRNTLKDLPREAIYRSDSSTSESESDQQRMPLHDVESDESNAGIPSPVRSLELVNHSASSIYFQWSAPTDNGSAVTAYIIDVCNKVDGQMEWKHLTNVSPVITSCELDSSDIIGIRVRAKNSVGISLSALLRIKNKNVGETTTPVNDLATVCEDNEEAQTTSDRKRRSSADSYEESTDKYSDCEPETDDDKLERFGSSKRMKQSPITDTRDELETSSTRKGPERRSHFDVSDSEWTSSSSRKQHGASTNSGIPGLVQSLKMVDNCGSFLYFRWSAPIVNNSAISSYVVDECDDDLEWRHCTNILPSITSCMLQNTRQIAVRVRAKNSVGISPPAILKVLKQNVPKATTSDHKSTGSDFRSKQQCYQCEQRIAVLHCRACNEYYCQYCSNRMHGKGSMLKHPLQMIPISSHYDFEEDGDESFDFKQPDGITVSAKRAPKEGHTKSYDKRYCCVYCGKLYHKLFRHLETKHRDKDDVKAWSAMPLRSKARTIAQRKMSNDGNYQHNLKVMRAGKGTLIVKRRSAIPEAAANYLPCTLCYVYMNKKSLNRHVKSCIKNLSVGSAEEHIFHKTAVKDGRALLSTCLVTEADANLVQMFNRLKDDDLKAIIVSDEIIRKHCCIKLDSLGTEENQKSGDIYRVNSDGRLMARIVQACRIKLKNSSITLCNLLVPGYFDTLVCVAKEMSTKGDPPALSLGKQIGFILCHALRTKQGLASRYSDKLKWAESLRFHVMFKQEWNYRVNTPLLKMINARKRSMIQPLPDAGDLMKFKKYVSNQMSSLSRVLSKSPDGHHWSQLAKYTMSRLIVFNKRRRAEVRDMTVRDYVNRPQWHDGLKDEVFRSLSVEQQEITKVMDMVISAGKSRKNVDAYVMLPPDCKKAIELLNETRDQVGVEKGNKFVFARLNAETPLSGHTELHEVAVSCKGLKYPERITSTNLRRYIASVSQVMPMEQQDTELLARHLGHDEKTHKAYYKRSIAVVQLSKVTQMLVAVDNGTLAEFKHLKDVDISDSSEDENVENSDESTSPPRRVSSESVTATVSSAARTLQTCMGNKRRRLRDVEPDSEDDDEPIKRRKVAGIVLGERRQIEDDDEPIKRRKVPGIVLGERRHIEDDDEPIKRRKVAGIVLGKRRQIEDDERNENFISVDDCDEVSGIDDELMKINRENSDKRESKKARFTKPRWTDRENKVLHRFCGDHITKKTKIAKQSILEVAKLIDRSVSQIRTQISNYANKHCE